MTPGGPQGEKTATSCGSLGPMSVRSSASEWHVIQIFLKPNTLRSCFCKVRKCSELTPHRGTHNGGDDRTQHQQHPVHHLRLVGIACSVCVKLCQQLSPLLCCTHFHVFRLSRFLDCDSSFYRNFAEVCESSDEVSTRPVSPVLM